ncbi:MAG TPA: flagellar biosynthetic protein FliO [Clostridiales bacterium]|nr:flagellar biosynthetic protein FliO [Clostridiales bacterium]HPV01530.1 flagellar biosynthetic protein FliO [Clostridiales bacterium]
MEFIDILKIILFLIGFSALLFLAYVTARYVGQKQIRSMQGRNISIVETVMLGPDKRLHLVRAGKNYVLIATTSKTVEFLTTVEIDEEAETGTADAENSTRFDFRSLFEKYSGIYRSKITSREEKQERSEEGQEGPAFRKNLEKLRIILVKSRDGGAGNDINGVDDTNDKDETRS